MCRDGEQIASIQFPPEPKFYGLNTAEGVPYWKIAQLHSARVLAAAEFIELSRTALTEASERVRQKFGFSCTAASASLHYIERWAGALPPDTPVTILHIS